MDLIQIQSNLMNWVEKYSGLEAEWGRLPNQLHVGPFALIYAGAISKQGHDEEIWSFDTDTDMLSVNMTGVRKMDITVSFRSFDQNLGASARQLAENFRTLHQSPSSIDDLTVAGLALVSSGALIETDYKHNGRMVSQADLPIVFQLRSEEPATDYDGSYIKTVNVSVSSFVVALDGSYVKDNEDDYVVDGPHEAFTVTGT